MLGPSGCALILVCSIVLVSAAVGAQVPTPTLAEMTIANSPSPELIGNMTKELGITPKQAVGGSGALLGLAKSKLTPEEFGQVANAIPGTDALLKAAPSGLGMQSLGGVAGLASLAGGMKSLGLSPAMAGKMAPVMTKFVESKGSGAAAKLLAGVLR
jgi:hypothetical protein